jgi:hypothetical protein
MTFVCTFLIATNSFSQNVSESFETQSDFTQLIGECWTFSKVSHTNSAPIDGVGSVASQDQGNNIISVGLNSAFKTGIYAAEVTMGSDRQTAKFVKQ